MVTLKQLSPPSFSTCLPSHETPSDHHMSRKQQQSGKIRMPTRSDASHLKIWTRLLRLTTKHTHSVRVLHVHVRPCCSEYFELRKSAAFRCSYQMSSPTSSLRTSLISDQVIFQFNFKEIFKLPNCVRRLAGE